MTNTVMAVRDTATGLAKSVDGSNGDIHISINGAQTAVSGTKKIIILDPDNADAADVAAERYNSVSGVKAFRVIPKNTGVTSATGILYGFSTTAGQLTAINSAMSSVATAFATPSGGGSAIENVGIILPTQNGVATDQLNFYGDTGWEIYDGTNTIKTIAVRSMGADYTVGVVLEVIE